MFFRKKHEMQKADLQEIKEAMSDDTVQEQPIRYRERDSAPLFVKVEKYRHITEMVQDMKSFVTGIKQLFIVMHEIEAVRQEALTMMQATVQRLEKNLVDIDNEMLMPKNLEMEYERDEAEISRVESSLLELQKQLSSLKNELQEFR